MRFYIAIVAKSGIFAVLIVVGIGIYCCQDYLFVKLYEQLEIVVILLLVLLNGLFALAEIAIVSSRKTRLIEKAKKGNIGAQTALDLLEKPEQFLSTMQIGITLVGIVSGMFGGVALAARLEPLLQSIAWLSGYTEEAALFLVVTLITFLSLVLGELVPKTLGLTNPEGIAVLLAPFVKILSLVTRPFTALLGFSTRLILRIFGVQEKQETPVSEEEMKLIIEQGVQHGVIEQKENEMIKGIFRFADRKAYSIMTSRRDIFWIDINEPFEIQKAEILDSGYSKIPVCDESLDNIIGILQTKTFINKLLVEPEFDIRELLLPPIVVPEATRALKILETFKQHKAYIGVVVDEYGVTIGVITLHDLIENIFGDLPQLDDEPEDQDIITREDGSMLIDGGMQIDELRELISINDFERHEQDGYSTIAGFVIHYLKKVPRTGEKFSTSGYQFEIMDMDFNRIDKVLISKE